ncbi:MAG: HD domain-containing protein, partial [Anaerolineales bacterium]|nr:HD domain-containing protein [Anaerolineales bacterium]
VSDEVFRNDAVRLARAVRFEAELQFGLDDVTAGMILRDAALVENAPMERVRDELLRIFGAPNILRQLRRLDALDLLGRILPEVNAMRGVTQSPPHIYDVFEHSLYAVAAAEETERAQYLNLAQGAFGEQLTAHFAQTTSGARTRRELLRFTLLLHDIGKPATRTVEDSGRIRFFGHQDVGVELVGPALRRLKLSNEEGALVKTIIAEHLRPILLAQNGISDRAVHRFFRDTGAAGIDVAVHAWCDQRATYGEDMPAEVESALQAVIGRLLDRYYHAHAQVVAPPALLNGNDIMEHLDIPPGPRIRVLLDALREAQAVGQVTTRAEALALLDTLE